MQDDHSHQRSSSRYIIAFSAAAAATAALVAIGAYVYLLKRNVNSPAGLLNRCQDAISQIQSELAQIDRGRSAADQSA
jgi:hypothetical protein